MARFSRPIRWVDALALFAVTVVLGAYFVAEYGRGLRAPVPWPDEGLFLWPALSFRDRWTLFAPELDPTRELFLMPPLFTVVEGLVFKVVPFSLRAARALSTVALCGAFAGVAAMLARSRARFGHVLILGAFLSCPIFGLVGNVARMESAVLLLVVLGYLLLDRGRVSGLGVLLLAALVHPNGAFAFVAGVLYFALAQRGRRRVSRTDAVVIAVAVAAWLAYAVYVGMHFHDFASDMSGQLRLKRLVSESGGGAWSRARHPLVWGPALALLVASVSARALGVRVGALASLAAAFFAQSVAVSGWSYEVYGAFALFLTFLVVVEVSSAAVERRTWPAVVRHGVVGVLAGATALFVVCVVGKNALLTRSLENSTVEHSGSDPAYFTSEDHAVIAKVLASLTTPGHAGTLEFVPSGDGLLFEAERTPELRYVQPTFVRVHPDFVLYHESIWVPRFVAYYELVGALDFYNKSLGTREKVRVRSRDGTENWDLYRWPAPRK